MEGTVTDLLNNGEIVRMVLLQNNDTIDQIPIGWHQVTGGDIKTGFEGTGSITKIIGIYVDNPPVNFNGVYNAQDRDFNRNFACVLYELKQAGVKRVTPKLLDGNGDIHPNFDYVKSFRTSVGAGVNRLNPNIVNLSNKLINDIGKSK